MNRPDFRPPPPAPSPPPPAAPAPSVSALRARLAALFTRLDAYPWKLIVGLTAAFLIAWLMADWTGFTNAQRNPGQVIYGREMTQLWTAAYRLIFIIALVLALIGLVWNDLICYWRPDVWPDLSLLKDFRAVSPTQRLWFSLALFGLLAYLFVYLLSVRLPEVISAGP